MLYQVRIELNLDISLLIRLERHIVAVFQGAGIEKPDPVLGLIDLTVDMSEDDDVTFLFHSRIGHEIITCTVKMPVGH